MKRFWASVRDLKRDFPVDMTVSIRTKPHGTIKIDKHRCFGLCHFKDDGSIQILIERGDESVMIDTVRHEWAHARTGSPKTKNHPITTFWMEHGRIVNFYNDRKSAV